MSATTQGVTSKALKSCRRTSISRIRVHGDLKIVMESIRASNSNNGIVLTVWIFGRWEIVDPFTCGTAQASFAPIRIV
jgi:hypothetical protein